MIPSNVNQAVVLTESGLYALILRSRMKNALSFRIWITSEVLPSIREKGEYKLSVDRKLIPDQEVAAIMEAQLKIHDLLDIPLHIAQVNACKRAEKETGLELIPLLKDAPAQQNFLEEQKMLEPADLGSFLGLEGSPQYRGQCVNEFLVNVGWQVRDKERRVGVLTDKGRAYAITN